MKWYKRKRKMITVYLDTKDSVLLKSKDKSFHVLYYILNQADLEHSYWYADKIHKERIMAKLERGKYRLNMQIFST
jgi:hypothetical protein